MKLNQTIMSDCIYETVVVQAETRICFNTINCLLVKERKINMHEPLALIFLSSRDISTKTENN